MIVCHYKYHHLQQIVQIFIHVIVYFSYGLAVSCLQHMIMVKLIIIQVAMIVIIVATLIICNIINDILMIVCVIRTK